MIMLLVVRKSVWTGLAGILVTGVVLAHKHAPSVTVGPGDVFDDRQAFYDAFADEVVIDFENDPLGPVVGDPWRAQGVVFDEAVVGDNMSIGDGGSGADNNIYALGGQDANIDITFPQPVIAFGLGVYSNGSQSAAERIIFFGENDVVLLNIEMPATSAASSEFVGFHAQAPIFRVTFVEGDFDSDYAGIGDVAVVSCPVLMPSSEVTRLGTPANPDAFKPGVTAGPVIGATWDPVIDHTTFVPDAIFDVVALSGLAVNISLPPLGTLLCDITAPLTFLSAPGVPFAIAVPNDCDFVGASLCTQGASVSTFGHISLANALDITIGTF